MYLKLRGRIVELYGTISTFSQVIGLSKNSVSMKLNGKKGFSQKDIIHWCEKLSIKTEEIGSYFFADEVQPK